MSLVPARHISQYYENVVLSAVPEFEEEDTARKVTSFLDYFQSVPSSPSNLSNAASAVLVVEKHCVMDLLVQTGVRSADILGEMILLTGHGYPDPVTRPFLSIL